MSEVVWKDPPVTSVNGRERGRLAHMADELKLHAGQWALVGNYRSPATGTDLKNRYGLEAVSRKQDDGTWDIYARAPEVSE